MFCDFVPEIEDLRTEAGGAARLAMPEFDSETIDKVADARKNSPHAEGGQRRMTTANIRAPKKEKIKGERNKEGRFAGFLAEACYFVELDGEAPEGVGEDVTDRVIEVVVTVVFP